MRKVGSRVPENAKGGGEQEAVVAQIIESGYPKKQGLNYSDVNALARAVRSGLSWEQAKGSAGWNIEDAALESYKAEVYRLAGIPRDQPVLPAGARAAAPIAEVVTEEEGVPASTPVAPLPRYAPRPAERVKPPVPAKSRKGGKAARKGK